MGHKNLFLMIALIMGKAFNLNSLRKRLKFFLSPQSWLPSDQSNPHSTVVHLGQAYPELLQILYNKLVSGRKCFYEFCALLSQINKSQGEGGGNLQFRGGQVTKRTGDKKDRWQPELSIGETTLQMVYLFFQYLLIWNKNSSFMSGTCQRK